MIINTTQVEMVLNNKAIPAYSLEAETGVSRDRISKLRRGDIKFENMSLKTIMKIQKWIDDENYKFQKADWKRWYSRKGQYSFCISRNVTI